MHVVDVASVTTCAKDISSILFKEASLNLLDMGIVKRISPLSLQLLKSTDHRIIGARQKLFFFDPASKGSCFFEPRGARIYNKLIDYLKEEYVRRGYNEVITPNIYSCNLWETSGHWDHYKDNMIRFQLGEFEHSLKPMNCPGHCLMFKKQDTLTSDQLPVRWADFGVLHRNELSGTLYGLSRGRKFQQDDAHIFCTPEQIQSEVKDCLTFARDVYQMFGFKVEFKLSLRPEQFLGEAENWDLAEESLRRALEDMSLPYEEEKFEGAFYGPKIDLNVRDCRDKPIQCATVQLDFQLPQRFDLTYKDLNTNKVKRPVIIHRAILGSLERFIAILAEHYEGKWPFWMSPLQAIFIPVHANFNNYTREICEDMRLAGHWVDCDISTDRMNAKLRNALLAPYNLTCIIGQREFDSNCVTCRLSLKDKSKSTSTIHNLIIDKDKLRAYFSEFETRRVDRADIELMRLEKSRQ